MQIIDGRKISKEILENIKKEISKLSFVPIFCDVLIGLDPASVQYVNIKKRKAELVGIKFHETVFPPSITTKEVVKEIQKINQLENMCGIIVQLPLPEHLDTKIILDTINPNLDVDCLGGVANDAFYNGWGKMSPPTALACVKLLDSLNMNLAIKNIVVLGQGELVGKPVTRLLDKKGFKPIILNSKSENKEEKLKMADVLISGIGRENFIKGSMLKKDVVIIDAGTSESLGTIVGDVDFESVKEIVGALTPVPGGVGPVTVAMLLNNVLQVAKTK